MIRYTATCLFGLEGLLGAEIDALGYNRISTIDGRITFEGDALACQRLLIKHGPMLPKNPDERFRTRGFFEFEIDGVDIDLMCVLSIVSHDMETVLPFDETLIERWEPFGVEKLPLMHLEDWYLIYALIEREPKLELIEGHFKAKGVNQQRLKQLLELNMPEKVRQRLTTWV